MYDYQQEKPNVFKEQNQAAFLTVRDNAAKLFDIAGAARFDKLCEGISGDSFLMIAFVDRLVELHEIDCVSPEGTATQYRVYIRN